MAPQKPLLVEPCLRVPPAAHCSLQRLLASMEEENLWLAGWAALSEIHPEIREKLFRRMVGSENHFRSWVGISQVSFHATNVHSGGA